MRQQALHTRQNLHARPPRLHPDIKPHVSEKRNKKKPATGSLNEGEDCGPPPVPKLQDGVIVAQYMYVRGGHGRSAGEQGATMELMTEYLDAKALDTLMFERTKEHDGIIQQVLQQLVWQRLPACAVLTIMAAVRGAARRLQQHYQVTPSCPNRQQPHSLSSFRFLPQSLTVAPPITPSTISQSALERER